MVEQLSICSTDKSKKIPAGASVFTNMHQPLIKNHLHMFIVQRIIDHLAVPPVLDQFGLPQGPKLMGNGRFGHPQQRRNVTDTHLGMKEGADDPYPGGIAENLEKIRQIEEIFLIRHVLPYLVDHFFVDHRAVAPVYIFMPGSHFPPSIHTVEQLNDSSTIKILLFMFCVKKKMKFFKEMNTPYQRKSRPALIRRGHNNKTPLADKAC
jgi:hypothetical protein